MQSFLDSELLKHTVSMALIIGESVKSLSENLKQMYPMVQWNSIVGLRDITAHEYRTLYMDDI